MSTVEAGTGVQSITRAFDLLEAMADLGGTAGLTQLSARCGLPLPTIHRVMRTLVALGYVRQEPSRMYSLGPRLARLGERAGGLVGRWAAPHLERLADDLGESANLALLDGDQVTYVAQAQGRQGMRMFTEVGRRAGAHCTAVGKAMLARLPERAAAELLAGARLSAQTDHTITDVAALSAELAAVRARGHAIDDEEQELGVRCVAVALPGEPVRAALSVSGPAPRMTQTVIDRAVPLLHATAARLAEDWLLAST